MYFQVLNHHMHFVIWKLSPLLHSDAGNSWLISSRELANRFVSSRSVPRDACSDLRWRCKNMVDIEHDGYSYGA